MQLHVLYAHESLCGYFHQPGFYYWVFCNPQQKRVLRWRGPFRTKRDAIASATAACPVAELIEWNSAQPDLVLWEAGARVRSRLVVGYRNKGEAL
jgi:hypothetical protein